MARTVPTKFCPSCRQRGQHTRISARQRLCDPCAAESRDAADALPQADDDAKPQSGELCPQCSESVADDAGHCSECGYMLPKRTPSSPTPTTVTAGDMAHDVAETRHREVQEALAVAATLRGWGTALIWLSILSGLTAVVVGILLLREAPLSPLGGSLIGGGVGWMITGFWWATLHKAGASVLYLLARLNTSPAETQ